MEAASLPLPRVRTRRWLDGAASVAFALAIALLAALVGGRVAGYQALVVRSDSMQPALAAGDLLVTKREHASAARIGEVITFADPSRRGELVTHRVVRIRSQGDRLAFVTRGDANTGVERWSIHRDGSVGRQVVRVPRAGYAVAWCATPAARLALVGVASVLLGGLALRRIWAS